MSSVYFARAITGALQPLTGPAAAGQLLVHSTGATGTVKAGAGAFPIVDGSLCEEGQVFVTENPATEDGAWPVTSSGTLVPVEALSGGPAGNTAAGTVYRWGPPLEGIEATSESSAGLSGGSFLTGPAVLRSLRSYKQIAAADVQTFFRAQLHDYPGALLAWESTAPFGGAMGSSPGPRTARLGQDAVAYRHTWLLYLVTSRLDSEQARRTEGDTLRDLVIDQLHQRQTARGLYLSNSPGVEILEARVMAVTPSSYVDVIRFSTNVVLKRKVLETFNDWLRTRLRIQTEEQAGQVVDLPDITIPMPPGIPGNDVWVDEDGEPWVDELGAQWSS